MDERKKNVRLSTMQILALGFFSTIFVGGILLWLPISNTKPISFVDALFTSTTSVCVTGLVPIVPAEQFTLFGKVILLILIQIGGLGVIACTMGFFIIIRKKITIRERVMIQQTYNMDTLTGMVQLILKIIKGTFFVEGIGAIFFAIQFVPEFGVVKGIWYAVFHSVSAFCNAGIDIIGDSSFMRYVTNPLINITTMVLIIMGGIGFMVWYDIRGSFKHIVKKELSVKRAFAKLKLHTKIAVTMTVILLVFGTISFLFMEYSNPETIGNMPVGNKVMAASFQSVTTRTAGFATISQSGMGDQSMLVSCILMFIGGSPGGTAGGVKTTTIAMLILTCIAVIHGRRDTECFGRKIPNENFRTGFSVVLISFAFLMVGTVLVTSFEDNIPFMNILYETTSAIATVGLSADLTAKLCTASKIVIMILMYVGRIGPVTMALVFGMPRSPKDKIRELPTRRIMVG